MVMKDCSGRHSVDNDQVLADCDVYEYEAFSCECYVHDVSKHLADDLAEQPVMVETGDGYDR